MTRHANEKYNRTTGRREFDAEAAQKDFGRAHMDGDVVRWNSNDRVPFDDMLFDFVTIGAISEDARAYSNTVREAETGAFIEEYRRKQPAKPSEEQLHEMRANHEPGAVIVDIISGRKTQL